MEKGYDKEMEKIHKEVENPEFVQCHDSVEMFNVKTKKTGIDIVFYFCSTTT